MASTRERRRNAGGNMANLIKDFHEEETFNTLYGGFTEEAGDNDFDEDQVSDDGSDVDFDEVEEDLEDDIQEGQDEDEGKRRRKKPIKSYLKRTTITHPKAEPPAKRLRTKTISTPLNSEDNSLADQDDDTDELSTTEDDDEDQTPFASDIEDGHDAGVGSAFITPSKKKTSGAPVTLSSRSIRDSTAAKRFETEELEMVRAQRKQEIGPRKKVKHHVPSQRERLAKSIHTERKNRADLERHERDEEENEKKKSRKPKYIRGPFSSCFISTTQTVLTDEDLLRNGNELPPLEGMEDLDTPHEDVPPIQRQSRNLLAFKEDAFEQIFSSWRVKRPLPQPRTCVVTGRPAHYLDPVTLQYYHDAEALKALHGVIYRHFCANPMHMNHEKVMEFIEWYEEKYNIHARGEHSQVGTHDYSANAVASADTNGNAETVATATSSSDGGGA